MSKLAPNVPTRVVGLDRPRTMALTLAALRRIKEATGSFDMELSEDAVFERAPALVWASLIDEDREDVSPQDVEGMLHAGNLGEVVSALEHLARTSMRGAEGNELPAPKKGARKKAAK